MRKITVYMSAVVAAAAVLVGTALFYRPNLELMAALVALCVVVGVYLSGKRGRNFAVEALGLLISIAAATWLAGYLIAQNL